MGWLLQAWAVSTALAATGAAVGALVAGLNGSFEGWRKTDYRFMFASLAAFVAAPIWPLTLLVLIAFVYRRAFPKPTPADRDDEIRRMEREAGLS